MNSLIVEPDTTDYWTLSGPGSQVVLCGTVYSNNFALQGPHLGQWTMKCKAWQNTLSISELK